MNPETTKAKSEICFDRWDRRWRKHAPRRLGVIRRGPHKADRQAACLMISTQEPDHG